MGAYLSQPVTEKDSADGQVVQGQRYGSSAMQGWRKGMEDSHVHACIADGVGLYCVFDGHGGAQASLYSSVLRLIPLKTPRTPDLRFS